MKFRSRESLPCFIISLFGLSLFLAATAHHILEVFAIHRKVLPLVAFALDGLPALVFSYGGYRLARSDFSASQRWRILSWSIGGAVIFFSVIGLTILIRIAEGRPMKEPLFPLLLSANAGGIAGGIAGYYNTKSRADAERAEQAREVLSLVNHILRHDLRNDLTVIKGYANMLSSQNLDGEEVEEHAAKIQDNSEKGVDRLEDTRRIAETLSGNAELEPVNLSEMSEKAVRKHQDTFEGEITTELPEEATVKANEGLNCVLDNLIENAIEHNDADEPRIEVAVENLEEESWLIITDNGPGIPEKYRDRDLTVQNESEHHGGLHLVATLVDAYSGEIQVQDSEPRGTSVAVKLPKPE